MCMKISEIDFGKFKAAMFDYDGTLTERGVWVVDDEIAGRMGELLRVGFPIAVCTGRQLNSFAGRFRVTFDYIREKFGDEAVRNLYLLAENGAVGYEFKASASGPSASGASAEDGWEMFYMAKWPEEVPKEDFESRLYALLKDKVEILTHHVPIVLAPLGRQKMTIDELNVASLEVFKITSDFMQTYEAVGGSGEAGKAGLKKTAADFLHIGDSGLGCLVCPAEGDKDSAIRVFWEFLKEHGVRGVNFSEKSVADGGACREIMVAGDSPQKNGNDYYFLNGRYGTAFSVGGDPEPGSEWPVVVVDEQGRRLLNSDGTLYLLNKLE